MQTPEGLELQGALQKSALELKGAVAAFSDEHARQKNNPEVWSVMEIIEHVAIVDELFSGFIASIQPGPEKIDTADREAAVFHRVASRETSIAAPAVTHPQGRFTNLVAAVAHFDAVREKVDQILFQKEASLRYLAVPHPAFGTLNGYEAFLIIAAHAHRHVQQILEKQES